MRLYKMVVVLAATCVMWAGLFVGVAALADYQILEDQRYRATRIAKHMQSLDGMGPGFAIIEGLHRDEYENDEATVLWQPNPFFPFGTCDDDGDCGDAVSDGCEESGNGSSTSDVQQNGCICSGRCCDEGVIGDCDGAAWFIAICSNPGCG